MNDNKLSTSDNASLARQSIKGRKTTLADLKRAQTPVQMKSVFIVCDLSTSMSGQKLLSLKDALKKVWTPGIKVYAFSDEVYDVDQSEFNMLNVIGGTAMLLALQETWNANPRHIILITDGQPTDSDNEEIFYHAEHHKDVPIDTIGISEYGRRGYSPDFLRELSRITGGKFTDCGQPIELTAVIQNLLLEAGKSEEKEGVIKL